MLPQPEPTVCSRLGSLSHGAISVRRAVNSTPASARLLRFSTGSVIAALLLTACASPLRLERAHPREQVVDAQRSAVSTGRLSRTTVEILADEGLPPSATPVAAARLAAMAGERADAEALLALAEISYLLGEAPWADPTVGRGHMTVAAVASWSALFRAADALPPFGPQSLLAQTIHNLALARLVESLVDLPGCRELVAACPMPDGSLALSVRWRADQWSPEPFRRFVSAQDFRVIGMRNRTQQSGIGAALLAERITPQEGAVPPTEERLPESQAVALTAVMCEVSCAPGTLWPPVSAAIDIVDPARRRVAEIGGLVIPVQADFTAALTQTIGSGTTLRRAGLGGLRDVERWTNRSGLFLLEPFDPDRIPVVFSHGLVSSPLVWREMVNDLWSHPEIRARYQFWFFMYPTGNPFAVSAANLRRELQSLRALHDPERVHPALDRIVLVGHSMGGLVSRLLVTDAGESLWSSISSVPFGEAQIDERDRELVERVFFGGRMPEVERVVFIAVPHRGSVIADFGVARFVSGLVRLPVGLVESWGRLAENNPDRIGSGGGRSPRPLTGIDSLSPNSPFLTTLAELPAAEGVTVHSIIGRRSGPAEPGGSDGVVPYESAHVAFAESELVIAPSDHSVPMRPAASREVLRILREHLRSGEDRARE